ncbi:MAG: transposase [Methylococcales bacterium]
MRRVKNPRVGNRLPPQSGPRAKDPINLTDEASRIMPSAQGFVQGYTAQAVVDVDTLLVLAPAVSQEPNDKQPVEPMLEELSALPSNLGTPEVLLTDNGYFSQANVAACVAREIAPRSSQRVAKAIRCLWRNVWQLLKRLPKPPTWSSQWFMN